MEPHNLTISIVLIQTIILLQSALIYVAINRFQFRPTDAFTIRLRELTSFLKLNKCYFLDGEACKMGMRQTFTKGFNTPNVS